LRCCIQISCTTATIHTLYAQHYTAFSCQHHLLLSHLISACCVCCTCIQKHDAVHNMLRCAPLVLLLLPSTFAPLPPTDLCELLLSKSLIAAQLPTSMATMRAVGTAANNTATPDRPKLSLCCILHTLTAFAYYSMTCYTATDYTQYTAHCVSSASLALLTL
jgi:hypothetical protein